MAEQDELSERMEPVCDGIRSYSEPSARYQFLKAITDAAKDYLALTDPAQIARELRDLEAELRKETDNIRNLIENLSLDTRELIGCYGEIPDLSEFSDATRKEGAISQLLGLVTLSAKIIKQKSQRRTKHTPIGQIGRGRPSHRREEIFVSRLATAYATATGQPTSRSWADDNRSDFEVVVGLALNVLGVPDSISATKLVEHHIRNRDSSK